MIMEVNIGLFILKFLIRLVVTGLVQFGTIYYFIYLDPQNVLGYLFLLLPFAIPSFTILNWAIIHYIGRLEARTESKLLRAFMPILVFLAIIVFLVLLTFLPLGANSLIVPLLGIFGLPVLILEILARYLWKIFFKIN